VDQTIECTRCGECEEIANDAQKADLKADGWIFVSDQDGVCPECRGELED
jgi:hypothetical protein